MKGRVAIKESRLDTRKTLKLEAFSAIASGRVFARDRVFAGKGCHNAAQITVLQEPPFTDQGSIVEVFTDLSVWLGIRKTIEQVNANAIAA